MTDHLDNELTDGLLVWHIDANGPNDSALILSQEEKSFRVFGMLPNAEITFSNNHPSLKEALLDFAGRI